MVSHTAIESTETVLSWWRRTCEAATVWLTELETCSAGGMLTLVSFRHNRREAGRGKRGREGGRGRERKGEGGKIGRGSERE